MKFIVKRSKWLRGEGGTYSYLLREEDQKRCCLGHCSLQIGLTPDDIRGVEYPAWVTSGRVEQYPAWMLGDTGKDSGSILSRVTMANDDKFIDDSEREEKLKALFAEAGDEIEFAD